MHTLSNICNKNRNSETFRTAPFYIRKKQEITTYLRVLFLVLFWDLLYKH